MKLIPVCCDVDKFFFFHVWYWRWKSGRVVEKRVDNAFHAGIKSGDTLMNTGFASNYQMKELPAVVMMDWSCVPLNVPNCRR